MLVELVQFTLDCVNGPSRMRQRVKVRSHWMRCVALRCGVLRMLHGAAPQRKHLIWCERTLTVVLLASACIESTWRRYRQTRGLTTRRCPIHWLSMTLRRRTAAAAAACSAVSSVSAAGRTKTTTTATTFFQCASSDWMSRRYISTGPNTSGRNRWSTTASSGAQPATRQYESPSQSL